MVKFSIILPCYNITKYLCKCLDSIFDNGFEDTLEIILINDGSTDSFIEAASAYFSHHCGGDVATFMYNGNSIVVVNQENGGLSNARNRGLESASGKYIIFIDPDDYVSSGYFNCLNEALNADEPDMLLLGFVKAKEDTKECVVDKKVVLPMQCYKYQTNRDIVENLFPVYFGISVEDLKNGKGSYLPAKEHGGVWRVCYRREFLKAHNIRFDAGLKTNEDRIFNSRCFVYAQSVKTVMEAHYNYVIRNAGLFRTRASKDMIHNKIYALQIRNDIVERLSEAGYDIGITAYAGSNVLSILELMNNSVLTYKEIKTYLAEPAVKESIRIVPFIRNIYFDVSLLLLKCRLSGLLLFLIRTMKKLGLQV